MTWVDWAVVAVVIVASIVAGMGVVRLSSRHGAVSYFVSVAERRLCHPERSEGSRNVEILRSAQNDDEPTTAFRNGNYFTSGLVRRLLTA